MAGLLTGVRVLVVDDHDDTREILEQSLRFQGAAIQMAANAAEAIAALDGVDIVVTDFAMHEHDGIRRLEQVARAPRAVPVMLLS